MKKAILYIVLMQIVFLQVFNEIKASGLTLIMNNHTATQGSQVVVPVRVVDFNAMLSIQGSIEFSPSVANFVSIEQFGLSGMNSGNFGTTQASSGKITFSWFDASMLAQTLADSSVIFAIRFNVIGNSGQQTVLNFSGSPTSLEFINTTLLPIPYSLVSGKITVTNTSLGILTIMADNANGTSGSQVIVPIRVKDFSNVLSMQGSIIFSPSVAAFISVEQFNLSGMSLSNFGTSQAGSGIITFSWFDQTLAGQTVTDSTIIFALRFNLTGISGSQTTIEFSDSPTSLEFTDASYVTFPLETLSGLITISNSVSGGLSFFPDSVLTPSLTQISVPIRTVGFNNMLSIQGTLLFDPAIATYSGITQFGLSGMDINNFGISQVATGIITFLWLDGTLAGQSILDSSEVFTITFDVIGNPGEYTSIKFSDNPTMLEFVDTSFNPLSASIDSGGIYIELPYSISTDSISNDSLCEGSIVTINYSTPNVYNAGNVFSAQLSDSTGSFSNPIEIGNVANTVSGIITAIIPFGTTSSSAYRIRVISSNPLIIGTDNGQDISILLTPSKPATPTGQTSICENSINTNYSTSGATNAITFTWQINPSSAGIISGTSDTATVNWDDNFSGNAYIFVKGNNSICTGIFSDSLLVSVNSNQYSVIGASICDGDSYIFGSQILTSIGTYFDTLTTLQGCDSIIELQLMVNSNQYSIISASICEGDSYNFGSQILTSTGTYFDTLTTSQGCDSIIELQLLVNSNQYSVFGVSICDGDSYNFGSQILTSTGTYFDTLTTSQSCDSIIELQLSVNSNQYSVLGTSICEGESYNFGSQILTMTGTYFDTLLTTQGCDSIIELQLLVNSNQYSVLGTSICEGESYNFGSQILTMTGTYFDTLLTMQGCDSIIELQLLVNSNQYSEIGTTICEGDSIFLSENWQTSVGTYFDTLQSTLGCDSIIETILFVDSLPYVSLSEPFGTDTIIGYPTTILDAGIHDLYLWSDGSTGRYFNITGFGWIYVTVTEIGNVCGSSTDSIFVEICVCGIAENYTNKFFNIYPNPATNEVFIKLPNNKQRTTNDELFQVFSIVGKKILEGKLEETITRISIKDLDCGVYIIEVGKIYSKLIISKKSLLTD